MAKYFVHWLYAEVNLEPALQDNTQLMQLLSLASRFHQPFLADRTETMLIPTVNRENFCEIFDFAFQQKAEQLLVYCFNFIEHIYVSKL